MLAGTSELSATIDVRVAGSGVTGTLPLLTSTNWDLLLPGALVTGTNTLTVTATDRAQNTRVVTRQVTLVVDTQPPTVPAMDALPDYQNGTPITVSWAASSDPAPGTGVQSYDLQHRQWGGEWEAPVTVALTETTASVSEGEHGFRVRARDGAGNESAYSTAVSTTVDWTAPVSGVMMLTTTSAMAWASGSAIFYGLGEGTFTVTVAVSEPVPALGQASGLDALVFPDTVSTGWVYERDGELTATVEYGYSFDASDTVSGTYAVTATDRATNATAIPLNVMRVDRFCAEA